MCQLTPVCIVINSTVRAKSVRRLPMRVNVPDSLKLYRFVLLAHSGPLFFVRQGYVVMGLPRV